MSSNWTSPADFRCAVREGRYTRSTAGVCPGYTQGNLAILPRDYADEFLRFARLNPRPCPVIGMSEPGSSRVPGLVDVAQLGHAAATGLAHADHRARPGVQAREAQELVGIVARQDRQIALRVAGADAGRRARVAAFAHGAAKVGGRGPVRRHRVSVPRVDSVEHGMCSM